MADQNFRVKRGLEVGVGGTVITAASTGNVGIGSTIPTSKLVVIGNVNISGVVTSTSFTGNLVGIATTALNLNKTITAGSGLTGGGELTADRTLNVGAGTGITVNADDVALKNSTSLTNNKVTKWDSGNGQLTDSSLTDTGTTVTIGTGITFYASTGIISATSFYGSGSNLTDLIGTKIDGTKIQNEGSSIGAGSSFTTLNFIGDYVNAVGVGSTANITFGSPSFASNSGISTNIKGGDVGDIPYQSATDTTTFLDASTASIGQVILWSGSVPYWGNVSAATGAFGGISVQDESTPIGTANSITSLNFVGSNLSVTATTGANGIATITMSDNLVGTGLSISGISTLGVVTSGNIFSTGIVTASQFTTGSGTLGFTTNTISGPSEIIIDPSPVGVGTTSGVVRIRGDLYVDGTQFVVNSSTIELADLRVGIATTVGTNALLDGGGIGIGSANILKTITWNNTASALTSSEDWNLASGKQYEINGTSVLTSTTLGSGVVNSSLTSVGTLGQLNVTGLTTTNNLNVTGVGTFLSSGLKIRNPANTFQYNITGDAITANRTLNLPLITGTDTLATLGLSQTFTNSITFSSTLNANATLNLGGSASGAHNFGTNQTTSTLTFGGTSGTGLITFGRATTSQQTDIQAGATASGNTKTINLGTGGLSGSSTLINLGPIAGVGTVVINTTNNVGIGSTLPTSVLDVVGDAKFTGVVTATSFSGTATTATNIDISATSSGDTTTYVVLVGNNVTGGQQPFIDNGSLTYNASTNVLTAGGGFSGDGSALTSLNGSQITSGTISGDRGVTSGSTSSSFIEYNGTTKTAGQFDGGTTDPNSTTRLNYDGYFYATRFYGDGSNLTAINYANSAGVSTNVKGTANRVLYNSATDTTTTSANLTFDGSVLGVGGTVTANRYRITSGDNLFVGNNVGVAVTLDGNMTVNPVIAFGYNSLRYFEATGSGGGSNICEPQIAIGYGCMENFEFDTLGNGSRTFGTNIVMGYESGRTLQRLSNSATAQNVIFGYQNVYQNNFGDASNNSVFGVQSGYKLTSSIGNALYGYQSGYEITSGSYNTLLGYQAGYSVQTGQYNIGIGYSAGQTRMTGSRNIVIGYNRDVPIAAGNDQLVIGSNTQDWIVGNSSYNIGIGTTNPTSKLHVIGDVLVSGIITSIDYNSTSDINLKENIQKIENPVDKVLQLNGVSFNWKESGRSSIGVIAQEVEKVIPELVGTGDVKTVNYNGLIGLLIEVVKEQQKQIDYLKSKIN